MGLTLLPGIPEMFWESPDGSRILGVLFANWYSNGIEIPHRPWGGGKILGEEAGRCHEIRFHGSSSFLMNGCDHQPVQTDLTDALKTAAKLYPDIDFVHSDFTGYMECLEAGTEGRSGRHQGRAAQPGNRQVVHAGQYGIVRIYLETDERPVRGPVSGRRSPGNMAHDRGMEYPHHLFDYGWKTLMQNHPHDGICGCSVDEVHREMTARFEKAEQVALHIIEECLAYFSAHVDTGKYAAGEGAVPFLVINPTGFYKSEVTQLKLIVKKYPFRGSSVAACLEQARQEQLPEYRIMDSDGNEGHGKRRDSALCLRLWLPKDRFRNAYFGRSVKVTLETERQEPFSVKSYCLVPVTEKAAEKKTVKTESLFTSEYVMENEWLSCRINENRTVDITHKPSGRIYREAVMLEDTRDIGNEYIYFKPVGEAPILSRMPERRLPGG